MQKEKFIKDIGHKIVLIAKERFGSQRRLSEVIGINENTIRRWIKGENSPDLYTIYKICSLADISLDWLVLGNSFESDVLDVNLFNDVFALAYNFAHEHELEVDGAYFIACYDYIKEELKNNEKDKKQEDINSIFQSFQPLILKLRKK